MIQTWAALVGGVLAGFFVGRIHARAGRARTDLKLTKGTIPKLQQLFWGLFRQATGAWLAIIAVVALVGYVAITNPGG